MGFAERLAGAVRRVGNAVLVGIDPRAELLPDGLRLLAASDPGTRDATLDGPAGPRDLEIQVSELPGTFGDDSGRLLMLVWNVAGASELELFDTRTLESRPVPGVPGQVVSGALLSRDGSRAVMSVEGPERPRELWSVDTATLTWTRATGTPATSALAAVNWASSCA